MKDAWPADLSALVGMPVQNLAVPGQEEPAMAALVPSIPASTTFVVYAGGTNDLLNSGGPVARIDDIVTRIKAQTQHAKLVLLTVRIWGGATTAQTVNIQAWNAHARAVALSANAILIDDEMWGNYLSYPGGIHPALAQVPVIAQAVAAAL